VPELCGGRRRGVIPQEVVEDVLGRVPLVVPIQERLELPETVTDGQQRLLHVPTAPLLPGGHEMPIECRGNHGPFPGGPGRAPSPEIK
jgi:hypothetical protein